MHQFDGIYHLNKIPEKINIPKTTCFPVDKLRSLQDNILVDKWYIPVKVDEALGVCLTSAIKLAQEGIFNAYVIICISIYIFIF